MILGTYANLGAIDEQQSGANIPIDRLPDIHVTSSINNDPITQAKIKAFENNVEIGPQKPVVDPVYENKLLRPKSRKLKPSKIATQNVPIRESIVKVEKEETPLKKPQIMQPIHSNIIENVQKPSVDTPIKTDDAPKSNRIANQLGEPTTDKKPSDSVINKEAIQREEHEIAINAKENSDAKLTKEMIDELKTKLAKQNEETQKLVLERINEKINEISEKVDNIAQMQNRSSAAIQSKESSFLKNQVQNKLSASATNISNDRKSTQNEEKIKRPLPVPQLLVDRQSSATPNQTKDKSIVNSESKPINSNSVNSETTQSAVVPSVHIASVNQEPKKVEHKSSPKTEPVKENIGRDILSNSVDYQVASTNLSKKSVKTEN